MTFISIPKTATKTKTMETKIMNKDEDNNITTTKRMPSETTKRTTKQRHC